MKKIFIYAPLFILISIFSSCSQHDIESDIDQNISQLDGDQSGEIDNNLDVGISNFTIENDNSVVNEGDLLDLTNESLNAVSYHWDFGNNDISTKANPTYFYEIHGDYTIKLTITDKFGNTQESSQDITVMCLFAGQRHEDF